MTKYKLVISPLARDDLIEIYQYGIRNWGASQAGEYLDKLKANFWDLTEQPRIGLERDDLLPDMRSFPIESHMVFYRLQQTQVEIVRILHGRQDPHRHLK
jgi:toxin ParE1/3/4